MPNSPTGLSLNRTVISQAMKKLGYDTHLVGKWHVGHCNDAYLPLNRGFDSFLGHLGFGTDYYTKVRYFVMSNILHLEIEIYISLNVKFR